MPVLSRLGMASCICFQGIAGIFNRGVSIGISRGVRGLIDPADGVLRGEINPTTVVAEATVCAHRANDRGAGNRRAFILFNNGIQGGAEVLFAKLQGTGRMRMAVEEAATAEAVLVDDTLGALPDQKIELDELTVFVIANATFTLMAQKGR